MTNAWIFVLASVTTATAQPAPASPSCRVSLVRTPDDVRAVVEQWILAEPRCASSLAVQIVPTDGLLRILATDESGHVRERMVPDADSAGALIVSWAADPLEEVAPPGLVADEPPPPAPASAAPVAALDVHQVALATPREARTHWLSLGGLARFAGGWGVRADADVRVHGHWALGVSASLATSSWPVYGVSTVGTMQALDVMAIGYLAHTATYGPWQVRFAVGGGVVHTRADASVMTATTFFDQRADGTYPVGEAAALIGFEVRPAWDFAFGPVLNVLDQRYHLMDPSPRELQTGSSTDVFGERTVDVTAYFALLHRL